MPYRLATPQFALGDLHACTQARGPVGAELMGALSLRIWASGCPPTSIGAREQCAERPRRLGGRSGRGYRHGNSWPKPSRDETGSRMAQSRGLAGWGVNRRAQATFFVTPAASANVFLSSTRKKSSLASRRMFLKPHPPTMTQECRGRIDPSRQCGGTSMVLGVRTEDSEGGSAPLSVSADL